MGKSVGKLVDTHAHLCDPVFDSDRSAVLERAHRAGIEAIVLVAENISDAKKNIALSAEHRLLKPAAGLYPAILNTDQADEMVAFIRSQRDRLVAIGEVGLDHWIVKDASARALQKEIFKNFITLAQDLELPLNVHSRSAGRHTVDMLLECGATRVQLHAFDGKISAALPAVEAGYFFSIPPSVVRSQQKKKLVKHMPLTCLLVETDSPVLGPAPHERNEPANVITSIEAIAAIKGINTAEIIEAVIENTIRLYGNL